MERALVARPHDTCGSWEIQLKCGSSLQEQGICSRVCVTSSLLSRHNRQCHGAATTVLWPVICAALGVTSLIDSHDDSHQ